MIILECWVTFVVLLDCAFQQITELPDIPPVSDITPMETTDEQAWVWFEILQFLPLCMEYRRSWSWQKCTLLKCFHCNLVTVIHTDMLKDASSSSFALTTWCVQLVSYSRSKLEGCIVLNEHNTVFSRSSPLYAPGVYLGPLVSLMQTASGSLQPFLHGPLGDRPTDRPTDFATQSVAIGAHSGEAKFCYCLSLQQVFIAAVNSHTPRLPFLRKRTPDGATRNWGKRHPIAAYYSSIDPEWMKGWIGVIG